MNESELHQKRSMILQDMALAELAMNALISLDYIGKIDQRFISEFLQEPRFTFELRRRLFKKVFKKIYPEKKFPWTKLEELQDKRNILAHARMDKTVFSINGVKVGEHAPHYQYHDTTVDAESLYEEFGKSFHDVAVALNAISNDTNITFYDKEGNPVS